MSARYNKRYVWILVGGLGIGLLMAISNNFGEQVIGEAHEAATRWLAVLFSIYCVFALLVFARSGYVRNRDK